MHLPTPARVAVIAFSLSLLGFLWTFGLPHQLAQPSLPNINHDGAAANKPGGVQGGHPYVRPEDLKPPTQASSSQPKASAAETTSPLAHEPTQNDKENEAAEQKTGATPLSTVISNGTAPAAVASGASAESTEPSKACRKVHGADHVMVIVKTSKAEIDKKLPTHLKTLLSCVPNFAIFSDHAGEIEGFPIYDALEDISNSTKNAHNEFKDYKKMKDDPALKLDSVNKELDKWKFLPMVYKAHKLRPYARFYFFIEADTSLSWTNVLQWSDRLDYRIPYYTGAPTFLNDVKFAQRGAGIVLSWAAMKQFTRLYDERYSSEWEERVARECCGDMVLATALYEAHVELYSAFPLLQGETPATLDWTDKHWCAPVVSWHHMDAHDIDSIWNSQDNYTTTYGWEQPYLFRNAFLDHVQPRLVAQKDEWDNSASDTKLVKGQQEPPKREEEKKEGENNYGSRAKRESDGERTKEQDEAHSMDDFDKIADQIKNATDSATTCKELCEKTQDCLQWRYLKKPAKPECHLGKSIKLGRAKKKTANEMWTSGWMLEKIQKKGEEWTMCEQVKWGFNQ